MLPDLLLAGSAFFLGVATGLVLGLAIRASGPTEEG